MEKKELLSIGVKTTQKIIDMLSDTSIDDLENIIYKVMNNRDDIYIESINSEQCSKETIEKCKDSEYGFLNTEAIEDL